MIVDAHVHIGKSEQFTVYFDFGSYLEKMDEWGVDKAVVMPNLSSGADFVKINEDFLRGFARLPRSSQQRLFPFLLADPNHLATLRQIQENRERIFGVKFHPSICQKRISDPEFLPFLDYCQETRLVLLVHSGRHAISHSSFVLKIASDYDRVFFILAHLGGNASELVEATLQSIERNHKNLGNVYLDTSASKLPILIENAVSVVGSHRVIFGSDLPYADFRVTKYCTEICELTAAQRAAVFSENILRLLRKANQTAFEQSES